MSPLLSVQDLVKTYPGVRAVDGVSFDVRKGQCFGLLGPNGAGKTTTLEILEGISDADSGTIRFRGAARDAGYREVIGIQFQHTALQDFQTVGESLSLFASFYRRRRPLQELIDLCHLDGLLDRDTRKLSGGQRQRLLLAIALVNDPDLVFLDEPTTGLDPQSRRNFWHLVETIQSTGTTVLMTTHYMEEASALCDEIAIIDQGRIIARGEPGQLLREHFPGRWSESRCRPSRTRPSCHPVSNAIASSPVPPPTTSMRRWKPSPGMPSRSRNCISVHPPWMTCS